MKDNFYFVCFAVAVFVAALSFPVVTYAEIRISEIAWMGSDDNPNAEWIELFNYDLGSGSGQDVEGWTLTDADGGITIMLQGTIAPMAYALLERSSEDTVPNVVAFQTYTGALSNSGETLTLKNSSNSVVAEVVGGPNWENIGGTNIAPKQTPQLDQSRWIVGTPSPGKENGAHGSTDEDTEVSTQQSSLSTTQTSGTAKRVSKVGNSAVKKKNEDVPEALSLSLNVPAIAYVNQNVDFEAVPSGAGKTIIDSLVYVWNFGDTYMGTGRKTTHTFEFPGEYTIVARAAFAKQSAITRREIHVLPITLILDRTSGGDVVVRNDSLEEIDLSGFTIQGKSPFTFPPYSILKAKGKLTISKDRFGGSAEVVVLFDEKHTRVAQVSSLVMTHESRPIVSLNVTAPVAISSPTPQESPQAVSSSPVVTGGTENIIRIGNIEDEKSRSFLPKIFSKISSWFVW